MHRGDRLGALEGLPLQMIVILVVVAIVVSGLFAYWTSSDAQGTESNLRAALELLAAKVEDVVDPAFYGPANYTLVLEDGAFTKIRSVVLGGVYGSPNPADFALRYTLSSGQSSTVVVDFRVWSPSEPLILSPGMYTLRLQPGWNPNPEILNYVNISAER